MLMVVQRQKKSILNKIFFFLQKQSLTTVFLTKVLIRFMLQIVMNLKWFPLPVIILSY